MSTHGDGGKGSQRRPGEGYQDGHDRIFGDKLPQAIRLTIAHGKPSLSLLMRKLGLIYNQAARLMAQMEDAGIVTPMQPHGERELGPRAKASAPHCTASKVQGEVQ